MDSIWFGKMLDHFFDQGWNDGCLRLLLERYLSGSFNLCNVKNGSIDIDFIYASRIALI